MNREFRGYIDHVGGAICPCGKTNTHFVDSKKISGKGLYKMASTFFTCRTIPPPVRTRIPTKCVYGKMSIQSAAPLYKNGLYKMTKPKTIFWGRTCLAQNDGLCRARALPFCAGSFKRDVEPHTPPFHLHSQIFDPCLTIPRLHGDRKKSHISGQNVER